MRIADDAFLMNSETIAEKLYENQPNEYFHRKRVIVLKDIENLKGQKAIKDERARIMCKGHFKTFDIITDKEIMILNVPMKYLKVL